MNQQPVSPAEVRRHIWESLVSMIRVYAHAASLQAASRNHDDYGVASTAEAIWITRAHCALQISYSSQDGTAHWRLESPGGPAEGEFHIDQDGHMLFPEGPRELDEAAIHWVQQLGQSACAA